MSDLNSEQEALIALSDIFGPDLAKRVNRHALRPHVLKSMVQVALLPKPRRTYFENLVQQLIDSDKFGDWVSRIWLVGFAVCHDPLVEYVCSEWRELVYLGCIEQHRRDILSAAQTAATQTGECRLRTAWDALQNLISTRVQTHALVPFEIDLADALDIILEYAGLTERVKTICKNRGWDFAFRPARWHNTQLVLPDILADPNSYLMALERTQHQTGRRTKAAPRETVDE